MEPELKKFEEELKRMSPVGMPDRMIARMEAAMESWQSADRNVVPFSGRNAARKANRTGRFWAAAAAVAILGAVAALLVPNGESSGGKMAGVVEAPNYAEASFAPMRADRNIINAADEGFVMSNDAQPFRAVRLESVDRIEFRNKAGEKLRIEAPPQVRILLIPVRTD